MIKQQHKLLKYHMLPVQVPGRSSNRRCRSRVTSDRAFGPARPDVRYTSNSDQILQSSEMSRRANGLNRSRGKAQAAPRNAMTR
jgi:GH25 family lysozyme M1 (1,4-beta-N-acetylmuramidase)